MTEQAQRPIGFWLKQLDGLIDAGFARILGERGLTRRHWQVLRTLHEEPADRAELDARLAPFIVGTDDGGAPVVTDFQRRGWLDDGDPDVLRLSAAGERAHDELWTVISAHRMRMTDGITADEYRNTVDVLSRMAANMS